MQTSAASLPTLCQSDRVTREPSTPMFTLDELHAAREVVGRVVPPTPQFAWPLLGAALGAEVWVKHEDGTPTGAFKVRGGLIYMDRLARERPHVAGVVSATRGNHGQSIALAGRTVGVAVTIVAPIGNSPDKNAAMRAFGAELVEHGHDFQAAREHAEVLAAERGFEMVHSFHRDLVIGVATYAWELFNAVDDLDVPDEESVREVVDPRGLQAHRRVVTLSSLVGQHDELRPPVMRVGVEGDEAVPMKVVDDALHVLAIRTEVARQPRHGLRPIGGDDGAEDLPAGAGQAERRHQAITRGQQQAVQPEEVQHEAAQGVAGRRSPRLAHLSRPCLIDIMMSNCICCIAWTP